MIPTKKSLLVVVLGVAFEHFDMMLVSLLASSMIQTFVGAKSVGIQLLYAYLGYAIAFLFRPFGAFCFGVMGDVYGRKKALLSSMLLMSLATLFIAFIPNHQTIGMTAAMLFFLCRIGQGMAVGGEYGTAMTYVIEFEKSSRCFHGALLVASTHVGGMLASVLVTMYADDFRSVFLIAGLLGLGLLLGRSCLQDSTSVLSSKQVVMTQVSHNNKKSMYKAIMVASMLVLVFYGSFIYVNEILYADLGIARFELFKSNTLLLGLWVIFTPCFGSIIQAHHIPYQKAMLFGALGVMLCAPLLGLALSHKNFHAVLLSQIILHVFHMIFCLCTPQFFGELFTGAARNTSISSCYALGASITAVLAPMICHLSIMVFQTNFAICMPFMVMAFINILILKKENSCKKMMPLNSMI
jgi:MFS family permease